jgi:hypothetical protein
MSLVECGRPAIGKADGVSGRRPTLLPFPEKDRELGTRRPSPLPFLIGSGIARHHSHRAGARFE